MPILTPKNKFIDKLLNHFDGLFSTNIDLLKASVSVIAKLKRDNPQLTFF